MNQRRKIVPGTKYHRIELRDDSTIDVALEGNYKEPVKDARWPDHKSALLTAYLVESWPNNIDYMAVRSAICQAAGLPSNAYGSAKIRVVDIAHQPIIDALTKAPIESSKMTTDSKSLLFSIHAKNKPDMSESEGNQLANSLMQMYFEFKMILEQCGQVDGADVGDVNEKFHETMGYFHQLRGYIYKNVCSNPSLTKMMKTEEPATALSNIVSGTYIGIQGFVEAISNLGREYHSIQLTDLYSSLSKTNNLLMKLKLDPVCQDILNATASLFEMTGTHLQSPTDINPKKWTRN